MDFKVLYHRTVIHYFFSKIEEGEGIKKWLARRFNGEMMFRIQIAGFYGLSTNLGLCYFLSKNKRGEPHFKTDHPCSSKGMGIAIPRLTAENEGKDFFFPSCKLLAGCDFQ